MVIALVWVAACQPRMARSLCSVAVAGGRRYGSIAPAGRARRLRAGARPLLGTLGPVVLSHLALDRAGDRAGACFLPVIRAARPDRAAGRIAAGPYGARASRGDRDRASRLPACRCLPRASGARLRRLVPAHVLARLAPLRASRPVVGRRLRLSHVLRRGRVGTVSRRTAGGYPAKTDLGGRQVRTRSIADGGFQLACAIDDRRAFPGGDRAPQAGADPE